MDKIDHKAENQVINDQSNKFLEKSLIQIAEIKTTKSSNLQKSENDGKTSLPMITVCHVC